MADDLTMPTSDELLSQTVAIDSARIRLLLANPRKWATFYEQMAHICPLCAALVSWDHDEQHVAYHLRNSS